MRVEPGDRAVGSPLAAPAAARAFGADAVWLLAAAAAVAVLMSTEFLFQPFVWRNYGLSDILPGWEAIAGQRLIVAAPMALALAVSRLGRARRPGAHAVALNAVAVLAGATVGELVLARLQPDVDRTDIVSLAGRILRWSLVGGAAAVMVGLWRSRSELARATQDVRSAEVRARRLAASTRLEALQRQIEPHFLFNTLATIRRLQETDPAEGQRMFARLLRYMTAALAADPDRVATLGEEIELVLAYLEVCASRMAGRLTVACTVDPDLVGLAFPPLVLATLAENAIKHGVFPRDAGALEIAARRQGDRIEVAISDDGVGFTPGEGGRGIGLSNASERLRLLYGPRAELRLQAREPSGVRACVLIPVAPA